MQQDMTLQRSWYISGRHSLPPFVDVGAHRHHGQARRCTTKACLECGQLTCVGRAQDDMTLQRYWYINGRHYSLTLEAWLARMDQHRGEIMPIMQVRAHECAI